jgi:hypothetical protein
LVVLIGCLGLSVRYGIVEHPDNGSAVLVDLRTCHVRAVVPLEADTGIVLLWAEPGWRPCAADFDGDGDSDQEDFGVLQARLGTTQPASTQSASQPYDLSGDGAVDQLDVDLYWLGMTGPASRPETQEE